MYLFDAYAHADQNIASGFRVSRVTDCGKLHYLVGAGNQTPGALEEQLVLLTTEPSSFAFLCKMEDYNTSTGLFQALKFVFLIFHSFVACE